MSLLSNWLWGSSQLDEAIEKATSELLPAGSEDIALNLEICDQIRSKSVPAKDAMRALKRRLNHKNPNVQLLALSLTDICVKNGGDHFLTEVCSREFVDNLVSILRIEGLNMEVKNTILRLLQNWSVSFEGKPSLGYVAQVCRNLQQEGFKFPPKDLTASNTVMVDTQTAPEWIDSDVCLRCRTPFTFTNRKHHCRNCGQVFDQACSSKTMALPHFGITQEVRVCDTCYNKLSKRTERNDKTHRHSASMHSSRHSRARDLADAELQRAIQLSLQEVGAAGGHARPGYVPFQPSYSEPPIVDRSSRPSEEDDDPELKAAIEASLREASAPKPSAPIVVETPRSEQPVYDGPGFSQSYPPGVVPPHPVLPNIPNYDMEPLETDAILTFNQTVEQVQAQGGRDMSRYPAVNELYEKANSLRPKLAMSVDDTGRKEQLLSDMHERLSEAVKLYDQLLSQQVAHPLPRWRSPEPVAPYGQVAPMGYAPASAQWVSSNPNGYSNGQTAGYQAPAAQASYFPPQEVQTPTQQSQQMQWHTQQQPISPQVHQVPPASATSSSSYGPTYQSSSILPTPVPQAPTSTPHLQYSSPPSSAPVQQQYSSLPSQQQQQQDSPQYIASPQSFTPSSPSHTLIRQNTVSYAPSTTPKPQPPASSLGRSNTLAHPPITQTQTQQVYQQSQQQQPQQTYVNSSPHQQQQQEAQYHVQPAQSQVQAPSAPPGLSHAPIQSPSHHQTHPQTNAPSHTMTLSQFPVAPTSAPQSFPLYGSTPSLTTPISGVGSEEIGRKEALLIDL